VTGPSSAAAGVPDPVTMARSQGAGAAPATGAAALRGWDVGLVACWLLAISTVALILWTFYDSPLTDPLTSQAQFLRLVRAGLVILLVLVLSGLLFTRVSRAEQGEIESRLLLDLAPGGLLLTDETGTIRFANPAAPDLLGYSAHELRGRPLASLVAPESRSELARLRELAGPGLPPAVGTLQGLPKGGGEAPLEVTVAQTEHGGRVIVGYFVRDVSEREDLVTALAARGAELTRSNRDLEQFAYVASHDLQEPLRMVGSFTQLLKERYGGQLDKDANEFLDFAQQGAVRMRTLIDDLLAYSRLGTRGQPFRPVALDTVVANALENLRETIAATRAEITHGPLPTIDGDPVQLTQVFQNLIANALKFRAHDPPHVTIDVVREGADWSFAVRDDGIGIPPELQGRLFVIFQRLHGRDEYPGSGIGLSVCKRVIERHGGRIGVESSGRRGEGTTFRFTLPAEHSKLPEIALRGAPTAVTRTQRAAQTLIEERLRDLV